MNYVDVYCSARDGFLTLPPVSSIDIFSTKQLHAHGLRCRTRKGKRTKTQKPHDVRITLFVLPPHPEKTMFRIPYSFGHHQVHHQTNSIRHLRLFVLSSRNSRRWSNRAGNIYRCCARPSFCWLEYFILCEHLDLIPSPHGWDSRKLRRCSLKEEICLPLSEAPFRTWRSVKGKQPSTSLRTPISRPKETTKKLDMLSAATTIVSLEPLTGLISTPCCWLHSTVLAATYLCSCHWRGTRWKLCFDCSQTWRSWRCPARGFEASQVMK